MKKGAIRSDLLLLLTAVIWGYAFVFQRWGMDFIGPFTYNGIRFALGAGLLYGFILLNKKRTIHITDTGAAGKKHFLFWSGLICGLFVFAGASLQQVGLVYTTAGNAGFITGLYVIFVPMLGLFFGQRPGTGVWIGAGCAAVGLYFLSVAGRLHISPGDWLVLLCALFWAGHVLYIGYASPKVDALKLAAFQYVVCSFLSIVTAVIFEQISWASIREATIPILYGGLLSVGVAYTLQIVAQKKAPPAHAAIILSLEGVFAVLGGWMILNETVNNRILLGCILMLAGMLMAQWQQYGKKRIRKPA